MTDKEILGEVYRKLETAVGGDAVAIRRFIEQEWQRQDDVAPRQTGWEGKNWYTDVRDMERHRELEIGPDGTVTDVK